MLRIAWLTALCAGCVVLSLTQARVGPPPRPHLGGGEDRHLPLAQRRKLNEAAWANLSRNTPESVARAIESFARLHGRNNWRTKMARQMEDTTARAQNQVLALLKSKGEAWVKGKLTVATDANKELMTALKRQDMPAVIQSGRRWAGALEELGMAGSGLHNNIQELMAAAHTRLQQFAEAERVWAASIARHERTGNRSPQYLMVLVQGAQVCIKQGKLVRAAEWLKKGDAVIPELLADDLFKAEVGPETGMVGTGYRLCAMHQFQRAELALAMGDVRQSEVALERALAQCRELRKLGNPRSLTDLAEGAIFQKLLLVGAPGRGTEAHRKRLLAHAETLRAHVRELDKVLKPGHRITARVLMALHSCCLFAGDAKGADEAVRQALRAKDALVKEEPITYAMLLEAQHVAAMQAGDYAKAEAWLKESRAIRERVLGKEWVSRDPRAMEAAMHEVKGDVTAALRAREGMLAVTAKNAELLTALQSDRQRIALAESLSANAARYLGAADRARVADSAAVYDRVAGLKGQALARQAELLASRDDPGLRDDYQELAGLRARMALLWSAPAETEATGGWGKVFNEVAARKEAVEARIAGRSAELRSARELGSLRSADIAALLPEGVVFVDLFHFTTTDKRKAAEKTLPYPMNLLQGVEGMTAFVVRKGKKVEMVRLGGSLEEIVKALTAWRAKLADLAGAPEQERAAAEAFARLVWAPLRPLLQGARAVIICPDGFLATVPFAALPGERGKYLIHDHAIGMVSSARQLVESSRWRERPGSGGLLSVGGVDYGTGGKPSSPGRPEVRGPAPFPPLPETLAEVTEAGRQFQAVFAKEPLLLSGKGATKGRLRDELAPGKPGWRYLFLASHAYYQRPQGLSVSPGTRGWPEPAPAADTSLTMEVSTALHSGLALTGANAPTGAINGDGVLTAEEAAGLDLRATELVVLSACYGAAGKLAAGEGVVGLLRAFHAAGARRVVAPLWAVSDTEARAFMRELTTCLWEDKLSPQGALRQAQLRYMRKRGDGAHPYFWAGYVCTGDVEGLLAVGGREGEEGTQDTAAEGRSIPGWAWAVGGVGCAAAMVALIFWRRRRPN